MTICDSFGLSINGDLVLDYAKTVEWKDSVVKKLGGGVAALLKRAKVNVLRGWATFSDARTFHVVNGDETTVVSAEHIILATGSVPLELPVLPFGGRILSSNEMLSLRHIPKRIVVVGAGYIGLELSSAFNKLGAYVAVIEAKPKILPAYDKKITEIVQTNLEEEGVEFYLEHEVIGYEDREDGVLLRLKTSSGEVIEVSSDIAFVAAGRRPATAGWGLERMDLEMNGPFVRVDGRCATSVENVWAIGDLVGEPMLAHKASAQGTMVAEIVAGRGGLFDPAVIPAVCLTDPQTVSVGLDPSMAAEAGSDLIFGVFPWSASARALTAGDGADRGFVRVVARRDNHQILGVQAVGKNVAELSGEFSLAIEMGAVLEDLAATIHAHPSLGEGLQEAVFQGLGHSLHT
jgi:dihydrolipoamide dehydrogenase